VGFITQAKGIRKILDHIGWCFDPLKLPGRDPPLWGDFFPTCSRIKDRSSPAGAGLPSVTLLAETLGVRAGFGLIPISRLVY
jgi:hypothetical protein